MGAALNIKPQERTEVRWSPMSGVVGIVTIGQSLNPEGTVPMGGPSLNLRQGDSLFNQHHGNIVSDGV